MAFILIGSLNSNSETIVTACSQQLLLLKKHGWKSDESKLFKQIIYKINTCISCIYK
jgi:hypothetical protein